MQKAIVIFALLALICQTKIIYVNPTPSSGSNSPPGAGSDGSPNPYKVFPISGGKQDDDDQKKWNDFKNANAKSYTDSQEPYRKALFLAKSKSIENFNKGPKRGWLQGINHLSDMTDDQFARTMLMQPFTPPPPPPPEAATSLYPQGAIVEKDWIKTKFTNWAVKNQGSCGSCWAFSAIGVIEANRAIKKLATVGNYSEQYLVDCVPSSYGAYGCNGGWPAYAIQYAGDHGGLPLTKNYIYTGVKGICKSVSKTQYQLSPWVKYITPSLVSTQILSTTMSVCVLVDSGWSSYASGVYGGCPPSPVNTINHAVVLVGIDANGNFKIRNSWRNTWGDGGYMWISGTNDCGVKQYAYIPVLK